MRIAKFINRFLIPNLVMVIILGLIVGYFYPSIGHKLQPLTPFSLFIMLYPMMVGMKLSEVTKAAKKWQLLAVALFLNYLISPLLGALLAKVFLTAQPEFAVGLLLTATVPCAGMVVAWTGMAKGNMPVALIITALSFLTGIVLIPVWMLLLAGQYVTVNPFNMVKTIFYVIVIPLVLGNLTRVWLMKKWGTQGFMEIKPIFPAVSALGMYMVFFISMSAESVELIKHPEYLATIAKPLVILYILMFSIPVIYAKLTRLSYADMVALTFSVGGKNISIALALALVFFGPLTVMIIAIKPLIQVCFMAGFYRLSKKLKQYWETKILKSEDAV